MGVREGSAVEKYWIERKRKHRGGGVVRVSTGVNAALNTGGKVRWRASSAPEAVQGGVRGRAQNEI